MSVTARPDDEEAFRVGRRVEIDMLEEGLHERDERRGPSVAGTQHEDADRRIALDKDAPKVEVLRDDGSPLDGRASDDVDVTAPVIPASWTVRTS